METILEFLVNNYLWFLIISLILVFGLIGYIVDTREKKAPKLHFEEKETENVNMKTEIVENKSLKEMIEENEKASVDESVQEQVGDEPIILEKQAEVIEKNEADELPKE